MPWPGTVPGWPEIALICSVRSSLIARTSFLGLLQFHQETFEFGSVGVRIDYSRRKQVGGSFCRPALVFGDPPKPPMNGYPNLISGLAVDLHRFDAPGDHRSGNIRSASASHLDLVTAVNVLVIGQFDRYLDKRLGHQLDVDRIVLGPVV